MSGSSEARTILSVHPGYFSTPTLKAEHTRLTVSLQTPESRRDAGIPSRSGLLLRRELVRSELRLRADDDFAGGSGLTIDGWDESMDGSIDRADIEMLRGKSPNDDARIPVPGSSQRLWAQHKYSVMARDPALYKELGPRVSGGDSDELFDEVITLCTRLLYQAPDKGRLRNALEHMWGYVSGYDDQSIDAGTAPLNRLAERIRLLSVDHSVTYLLHSTALCDLDLWVRL